MTETVFRDSDYADEPTSVPSHPAGGIAWRQQIAEDVARLYDSASGRNACRSEGLDLHDPILGSGGFHGALVSLIGLVARTPKARSLEAALLAELLAAASCSDDAVPMVLPGSQLQPGTQLDFQPEAWRGRVLEAVVEEFALDPCSRAVARSFAKQVNMHDAIARITSAARNWTWVCATPLAGHALAASISTMSSVCEGFAAVLSDLGDANPNGLRTRAIKAFAGEMGAIFAVGWLYEMRRRRLAVGTEGREAVASDPLVIKAFRRAITMHSAAAFRWTAVADLHNEDRAALRRFCMNQFSSVAEVLDRDMRMSARAREHMVLKSQGWAIPIQN